MAADTGTERSRLRTVEPASSEAAAESRNQPMNAIQIPVATEPRNSSSAPAAIIR